MLSTIGYSPSNDYCILCYIMSNKKKPKTTAKTIDNRRARFDYEIKEDLVVGIALTGIEVRAARDNHVQLKGSYVTIRDGELWLNNASFSVKNNQKGESSARTVDTSARKLLAHRKQIDNLIDQKKAGMSIVPLKMMTNGKFIKVVIAVGKGKKKYDKRETLKRRDQERDARRAIRRA